MDEQHKSTKWAAPPAHVAQIKCVFTARMLRICQAHLGNSGNWPDCGRGFPSIPELTVTERLNKICAAPAVVPDGPDMALKGITPANGQYAAGIYPDMPSSLACHLVKVNEFR